MSRALYLIIVLILVQLVGVSEAFSSTAVKLIVPAYFYPTLWNESSTNYYYWMKLVNTSRILGDKLVVIVNPSDGPGDSLDPYYEWMINNLTANNAVVIGYVYTNYTFRNVSDVYSDIDKWLSLYPEIRGFFIDEVNDSSTPSVLDYYRGIYSYIKSKGNYYVVLNPGCMVSSEYISFSDSIILYEDTLADYLSQRNLYANVTEYGDPGIILWDVTSDSFDDAVYFALSDGYSLIYIYHKHYYYDELTIFFEQLVRLALGYRIPVLDEPIHAQLLLTITTLSTLLYLTLRRSRKLG